MKERADFSLMAGWIEDESRVLDLGCGDGSLLEFLIKEKNTHGLGVEIDIANIENTIKKRISVVQQDLNSGLSNFLDCSFDYVVLSQTIQETIRPGKLLNEILRIGKYGIVSFPNFGNVFLRIKYMFTGRTPVSSELPFEWYETPNIHFLSLKDFRAYCKKYGILIKKIAFFAGRKYSFKLPLPNLFARSCVALIVKK
ncbi:MAG: methionine biosynthesis protein MetW [Brevinematales bacterium]|jgi:methionine biosynthesis protein MetW